MARSLKYLLACLLLASVAHGQTVLLNKFGPVSGVLIGSAGNPATTAAAIGDFQTILSTSPGLVLNGATGGTKGAGTINATGLYVNGSAVGVGGGAVSSVALGAPGACFGVTGSPVTSSGTLAYTLSGASSGILRADGSCSNTPVVIAAPSSGVAETVTGVAGSFAAVFNGATTTGQSRGIQILAGTNASDHALVVDNQAGTIDYFTIQGDGSTTLGYNGTNAAIVTAAAGNVTVHAPSSGIALASSGAANGFAGQFIGSSTTGQSRGLQVNAGTNSSDFAFQVNNQANSITYLQVSGNGALSMGPAANSLLVSGTTGGVTINAPSSGSALTVAGNTLSSTISTTGNTGVPATGQSLDMQFTSGQGFLTAFDHSGGTGLSLNLRGTSINFITGSALGLTPMIIGSAGNVTVAAPSSGANITLNGIASTAQPLLNILGGTNGSASILLEDGQSGTRQWIIEDGNPAVGNLRIRDATRSADVMVFNNTGGVTVNPPSSGDALVVNGLSNAFTMGVVGGSATGQSDGLIVIAGTNSSDISLEVQNRAGVANLFFIHGDGSGGLGATANALTWNAAGNIVAAAPSSGTTLAVTGTTGITAIAANGNVVHGEQCAYKTSTTARSSNTTPAADPDLTVTLAVGGTYVLDMWIEINATSGGTQGFQFAFDGTAATGGLQGGRGTSGYINGAVFALPEASINNTIQNIATISTTVNDWLHVSGTWTGFSAGTFFLKWAQNTSNVSSTNVLAGAYMCVKQIG